MQGRGQRRCRRTGQPPREAVVEEVAPDVGGGAGCEAGGWLSRCHAEMAGGGWMGGLGLGGIYFVLLR